MASIRIPFQFDGGSVGHTSALDVVARQKIVDVLNTSPFERVMRHNYGANLQSLLFEPIDGLAFADFKTDAIQTLNENLSRIQVLDLIKVPNQVSYYNGSDETTMTINVVYRLPLGAPKVVEVAIAIPGALNEDTPI